MPGSGAKRGMTDVLVVGAGPVGLTMAAELARYGMAVRVVDRAAEPTETSKALVIWSRTLELFDRMGCTQPFLDAGIQAHGASIRGGGRILGQARFDDVASAYNFALMIPQSATERLMTEHLATFGVRVEREVEVLAFAQTADGVEVPLRHADGHEELCQANWLIGCDGAHSVVRHALGVEFSGQAQGDDWVLADVRLAGPGAPPADEVAVFLHRDGVFVVFPMPGGRARIVATIGKTDPERSRPDPTLPDIQALIEARTEGGFVASDPVWLSTFHVHERKVASYRDRRVFLAGDAAHIHSPAGGQGMNTGMHDAINLAWKLAMVAKGAAAASLLDSYSPERGAVGELVLRNATRMTAMATLSGAAAQAARNLALRFALGLHAVRDRMAATLSETEIAYRDSPLSVGGRRAGDRLLPASHDGLPPGSGRVPRFVLFARDTTRGTSVAARCPELLEAEPRLPPEREGILIVRPDGYVGFSGNDGDWGEAEAYLVRLVP